MLRNALLPVVTMAGVQVGGLLGGSVVVETVFAWPGLGQLAYQSLFARDINLLLGIFFISSCLVVVVNLLVDLVYLAARSAHQGRLMQRLLAPLPRQPARRARPAWLGFVVLLAASARRLSPPAARSPSSAKPFAPPLGDFLFGTDSLGRDLAAGLLMARAPRC